jgi:hypothetical protein
MPLARALKRSTSFATARAPARSAWPLSVEPWEVLQREEDFDSGKSSQAPEGDEQVLEMVAHLPGAGLSGWTIKGIFTEPSVVSQFEISALGGERTSGYWSHRQCDTQIVSNLTVRRRLKLF